MKKKPNARRIDKPVTKTNLNNENFTKIPIYILFITQVDAIQPWTAHTCRFITGRPVVG